MLTPSCLPRQVPHDFDSHFPTLRVWIFAFLQEHRCLAASQPSRNILIKEVGPGACGPGQGGGGGRIRGGSRILEGGEGYIGFWMGGGVGLMN